MDDAQWALTSWGRFWRGQGSRLGYPRVNQICRMMHTAKLGATIQHSRNPDPEIHVPRYIEEVDVVVAELPQRDRAILSFAYQRDINRKTLKRKSPVLHRALLRAEAKVYASLGAFRHMP